MRQSSGDLSYFYGPSIIIYNCFPLRNTERSTWLTLRSLICQNNSALHTLSADRGSRRSPSTRPSRCPFPRQQTPSRCRTRPRTGGRLRHLAPDKGRVRHRETRRRLRQLLKTENNARSRTSLVWSCRRPPECWLVRLAMFRHFR